MPQLYHKTKTIYTYGNQIKQQKDFNYPKKWYNYISFNLIVRF
jgi:hypothetical protein